VHPEDKVLGDIMVKYYRLTNQDGNVAQDYFWQAFPDLFAHYYDMPISPRNERFPTVSIARYVGHVSNYLLWENPGAWTQNSWDNFLRTTDFSVPQGEPGVVGDPRSLYGTSVVANELDWRVCGVFSTVDSRLMLGFYLTTFACVAVCVYQLFLVNKAPDFFSSLFCLVLALGVICSILSTCVLATYYPRFAIPVVPFMVICTAWVLEFVMNLNAAARN
jgi:hypothetical protein